MAKRLKAMGSAKYQRDGDPRTSGPGFGLTAHEDALTLPLTWRKPRRVFVNSMSDLFHDQVPDEFIARVWAVMAATPQHTYQCLTKRHGRMRSLLNDPEFRHQVAQAVDALRVDLAHEPIERWAPIPSFEGYEASTHGRIRSDRCVLSTGINPQTGREAVTLWNHGAPKTLPVHRLVLLAHAQIDDPALEVCHRNGDKRDNRLANLRWGTRAENQQEKVRHGSRGGPQKLSAADAEAIRAARAQGLTQQAIADKFGVSRPLVSMIESGKVWGPPDLPWPIPNVHLGVSVENQQWADIRIDALRQTPAALRFLSAEPLLGPLDAIDLTVIGWVIAGGESGPGARPMRPDWVRSLRDRCVAADVPFFFKQWGEWCHSDQMPEDTWRDLDAAINLAQPHPEPHRVGKKRAGRLLDGRTWDEYPRPVMA